MSGLVNYLYGAIYGDSENEQTTEKITRKYGWKRGVHYDRAEKISFEIKPAHDTIKVVDLRSKCPPVYDQGHLGSCTANAIGFCYQFDELKQNESSPFVPSRLFIYYNERNMEGHINQDAGAEIHDGVSSINHIGVCPEEKWPYDISKFTEKPKDECYDCAKSHRTVSYKAVNQSISQLKAALINGFPVVFGFSVYSSFESPDVAKTGIMPIPKQGEELLGGHAVALVGFDDTRKVFIVRNSWGDSWGDEGYFYMPYEFIENPQWASDFWTITKTLDSGFSLEEHLKNKLKINKIINENIIEKTITPVHNVRRKNRKMKRH